MTYSNAPQSNLFAETNDFSQVLLEVSLTGFILFRPVFDEAAVTIQDLAYEYLNPAAQQMLRLPARPAETFLTLYPGAREEGIFAFYCGAFFSGQTERLHINYQHDGLDGYFHLVARRSGELLVVSFTDTNDQPRSAVEEALRQSQAREKQALGEVDAQRRHLQQVLQYLPAQVATYQGPEHIYDYVNIRYTQPMPERHYLGRPLREVMPEVAEQGLLAAFDAVYRTGEPYHVPEQELWLDLHGTGQPEQLYLSFFLVPLRDAKGQIYGLLNFSHDVTLLVRARQQVQNLNEELQAANHEIQLTVTALKRAQLDLHQLNQELEARVAARTHEAQAARAEAERQQSELQRVFEQAPMALFVLHGPSNIVRVVNPAMSEMLGLSVDQLLGRSIDETLPEVAAQGYAALLAQVRQTGQAVARQDSPARLSRHGPDETGYFSFVYQPIFDLTGDLTDIMFVAVDVTAQVLARQQVQALNEELAALNEKLQVSNEDLRRTNERLVRTNADLDNFIYTASHDLKAPISNIEGLLLLLQAELLPTALQTDETVLAVLNRMQGAVERFKRTIYHLTEVSKLQLEFGQPAATVQMAPVVENVRQDLLPLFTETGGQLIVDMADCPALVFSEKNLRSVIYNLVSNALKYRHPERAPQVHVGCHCEAGRHVLRVQDNGLGIAKWQQDKLFGLFQRLHTHVEGTGVGLYMVKKMVENAGGTLTVQSQENVGSTFTIILPTGAV